MTSNVHVLHDRSPVFPQPQVAGETADPRTLVVDLLRLIGSPPGAVHPIPPLAVSWHRVHAGEALHYQGAVADAIHFVRAGAFKIFHTAQDGYEQVLGFAMRGEVLGFEALAHGKHPSAAVALEESSVYRLPLSEFESIGQRLPQLDRLVHRAVSNALLRHGELAEMMSAVAAEVRLARFLLQLSRRMEECGQSARRFYLRMGRRDIASYLGVAHETVSRSFGVLARCGCLRVNNREVEILDLAGLKQFALNTRRIFDEDTHAPCHRHELHLRAS